MHKQQALVVQSWSSRGENNAQSSHFGHMMGPSDCTLLYCTYLTRLYSTLAQLPHVEEESKSNRDRGRGSCVFTILRRGDGAIRTRIGFSFFILVVSSYIKIIKKRREEKRRERTF